MAFKFLSLQSATSFIFFLARTALPAKVTFLTDGDSCNCNEDLVLVVSFAKPFVNDALFPLSKSRTTKYLESSWHLLINLISAVISLPELNIQENKPSELAVVPTEITIRKDIKRIITPFICDKITNDENHSIFLIWVIWLFDVKSDKLTRILH